MTYPLSSAVSAGNATLAAQYNNLRLDALHLGQATANAIDLATLLERYESRLTIERLNTDQLRVPASATDPVSLVIGGYMLQAVANVDLDAGEKPSGAANTFYIFANRTDSSTTFTLTVSTSVTESATKRLIGRFYWDSAKIEKDSIRSEMAIGITNLLYFVEPQTVDGRLTLSTGVPVPTSDIASSGNVYFTPFTGNRISLYVPDYGWRVYTFSELTLSLAGIAQDKNVDVFIYDNAGTLTLSATEWSNATLRATALTRQDGLWVKSGAEEYRYLGTVRTSGAAVACDTELKRFVWNLYNQVTRNLYKHDNTDSWVYTLSAFRPWNNDTDNKVEFIIGLDEKPILAEFYATASTSSGTYCGIGIALDASNVNNALASLMHTDTGPRTLLATYFAFTGIGYHYLAMVERSATTNNATFYGDNAFADNSQLSAMIAFLMS